MATELLRPGVSVIQEFRTVSPTIVTPTLVPCAIAPCFQILEAYVTDAVGNRVINSDAVANTPAIVTATAGPYTSLATKKLRVRVNGGPTQEIEFASDVGSSLTATQVKNILNAATREGWAAYVITKNSNTYLQLRTTATGDSQSLQILDGDANTALGFKPYWTEYGLTTYRQDRVYVSQANVPDPRGIADEMDIDEDSIRVFVDNGTPSLTELKRTESFLRRGCAATVSSSAAITFTTVGLNGKKLYLTFSEGGIEQFHTFGSEMASMADLVNDINSAFSTYSDLPIAVDGGGGILKLVSSPGGYLKVGNGTDNVNSVLHLDTDAHWAVEPVDDGDGDSRTPIIKMDYENFMAAGAAASLLGTATLSSEQRVHNKTFILQVDGSSPQEIMFNGGPIQGSTPGVFPGSWDTKVINFRVNGVAKSKTFDAPADLAAVVSQINSVCDGLTVAYIPTVPGGVIYWQVGGDTAIEGGEVVLVREGSDAWDLLGLPSVASGTGDSFTKAGDEVTLNDSAASWTSSDVGRYVTVEGSTTPGNDGTFLITAVPSGTQVRYTNASGAAEAFAGTWKTYEAEIYQTLSLAEIVTAINATMGTVASNSTNKLLLTSTDAGEESKIEIGSGTANSILGFTAGAAVYGSPFPVAVGDALYVEGVFAGYVTVVAPGGSSIRLKLDREVLATTAGWNGVSFYIVARNIPNTLPSTRPTPNLVIDSAGAINLKHDIFRNTLGAPIAMQGRLIIAYRALRLDVSAEGTEPSLLTVTSTDDIEDGLAPINADNPLALMLYFMAINAPGIESTGIGVDAVSDAYPDGTPEAYSRAMTFLESQEVYALAPATQEAIIHQMFMTHVDMMSEPDNKGERIVLINPEMPGEAVPTLVSSGTDGDSTGTPAELDTKLATLAVDLLAHGIDPSGDISVSDGVYLDIASDTKRYNIKRVTGTVVTANAAFSPGENEDGFYATTALPVDLVSESFTIYIRGEALVTSTGKPDYARIAQAYQDTGKLYGDRRVVMVAPDYCSASIEATEQKIKGYYMCAGVAAMIGQLAPQQGFTNYPMTGYMRVLGSTGTFSEKQMSVAAAGGTYWIIQEVAGGPLTCRHQLTTDLTSIETRELSITKVVDFTAKFMRSGLRNFIGKFNVTQPFLDMLSTVVQGQLGFLVESGVLIGGDLNNIVQDKDAPDTVLIDCTLDVPYPANYLRLTLII